MKQTVKKLFTLILIGTLALTMLIGCTKNNTPANGDQKLPDEATENGTVASEVGDEWKIDIENHWKEDANGEKVELAAHNFDVAGLCEVCNSEFTDYEDGSYEISMYNEHEDVLYYAYYQDGELISSSNYEYTYDEDGNMLNEKAYADGELFSEMKYTIDGEGFSVMSEYTYYYGDGEKSVTEYNEYGDRLTETDYSADGSVTNQIIYTNEYDESGNMTDYKAHTNGVLSEDFDYAYSEDGYTYPAKMLYYYDDGTSYAVEQDEDYNTLKETDYDADGNVTTETVYEYTFDDDGNVIYTKSYVDGVLFQETEGAYDEDGWVYDAKVTTYYDDGSKNITEYDSSWEELSNVTYDSDGNVIEDAEDLDIDSLIGDLFGEFDYAEE